MYNNILFIHYTLYRIDEKFILLILIALNPFFFVEVQDIR